MAQSAVRPSRCGEIRDLAAAFQTNFTVLLAPAFQGKLDANGAHHVSSDESRRQEGMLSVHRNDFEGDSLQSFNCC